MKTIKFATKFATKPTLALIALAVAAASLTGCVVAPARGYVVAPAPVVVVHGYYR